MRLCSDSPNGVFHPDCCVKPVKGTSGLITHTMDYQGNGNFCNGLGIRDGGFAIDAKFSYHSITDFSHLNNGINFPKNDNENNEFMYYGWEDIEIFEDVDKMIRGCDPTFGIDAWNNGDQLWVSSSNGLKGSENETSSGLKLYSHGASGVESETACLQSFRLNNAGQVCDGHNDLLFSKGTSCALNDQSSSLVSQEHEYRDVTPAGELDNNICSSSEVPCAKSWPGAKFEQEGKGKPCSVQQQTLDSQTCFNSYANHGTRDPILSPKQPKGGQLGADYAAAVVPPAAKKEEIGQFSENSIEAVAFFRLQHAVQQLDVRTRLCIRDGLYRLARSAERRHNRGCATFLMVESTKEFSGLAEAPTNAIDRSIAHLLFHRPPSAKGGMLCPGNMTPGNDKRVSLPPP